MDFDDSCRIFGGTIFLEEYCGNYAAIETKMATFKASSESLSHKENLESHETSLKLLDALVEECAQAPSMIRWCFRGRSYRMINYVYMFLTPMFRGSPIRLSLSSILDTTILASEEIQSMVSSNELLIEHVLVLPIDLSEYELCLLSLGILTAL